MQHKFSHFFKLLILVLFVGCWQNSIAQFYNGTQVDFGKNRVQYDDFEWQFYRFNRFETYFYTGGKQLAEHTAKYANVRIGEIEKLLDFKSGEKIQFVIYNKQSHYRQSNIGLNTNVNYNIGGVNKIIGTKVFVYFDGDYASFEKQLDAGILEILSYQLLYGGNWRQVLRNSTLLTIPEWYINGLVSYYTNSEDPLIQAKIKDGILNDDFKKFNSLDESEAVIAGHAIWQYIAETYGEEVIANILYMTRVSREVNDGFLYVIGVPFTQLYQDWIAYFSAKYKGDNGRVFDEVGESLEIKTKKNRRYQNFKVNASEDYIAYSTNQKGQYKIYIREIATGKRTRIFKKEHKIERLQDYSYPIVEWHPSGKYLTFITEKKGDVLFYTYDIEAKDLSVKPIFKIEKVLSYSYLKDGKQLVFSGLSEGQSDLYLYSVLGNAQKKLTDDIYDDLLPVVNSNGTKAFFISNRPNDSLNVEHEEQEFEHEKDVYVIDLDLKNPIIQSVTNTDQIDENSPKLMKDKLNYLVNQGGESSIFSARFDSAVSRIDTTIHYDYFYESTKIAQYNKPLLSRSYGNGTTAYQSSFVNGRFAFYKKQLSEQSNSFQDALNSDTIPVRTINAPESFTIYPKIEPFRAVNYKDYQFESAKLPSVNKELSKNEVSADKVDYNDLDFPTQRIYKLNFRTDNSVLQLNRTFINGQYQIFNGGPYTNAGLGINTKIGIVDLMEDHKVYGGFRYSGDIIEYSLSYQNLKHRLDKEYMVSRTRQRFSSGEVFVRGNTFIPSPYDIKTLRGVVSLSYPFSEITSLRGVISARNDKIIPLSASQAFIEFPIIDEYWGSLKSAYVFDNTREIATNILYGTRYKLFAEYYQLAYSEADISSSNNLAVVGFDFRHYQKIHRELIAVGRVAGSKSFGRNPLVYYLGGVDEWWSSDIFDESTPIDNTQNYGFQALAANLRGFKQNIRNGNSFVVINTELRWPIISYFVNRPVQSEFLRNFQLIGFADAGTAWIGKSPYADDNPLNNETTTDGPIVVTYENINEPIVGGTGFGLRSTLFGYFVRLDFAWGIENREFNKQREVILSLTLDI